MSEDVGTNPLLHQCRGETNPNPNPFAVVDVADNGASQGDPSANPNPPPPPTPPPVVTTTTTLGSLIRGVGTALKAEAVNQVRTKVTTVQNAVIAKKNDLVDSVGSKTGMSDTNAFKVLKEAESMSALKDGIMGGTLKEDVAIKVGAKVEQVKQDIVKPLQDMYDNQDERVKEAIEEAAAKARAVAAQQREQLESEIANHFLDGMKYGVCGSDGSKISNYCKFLCNNHPLIAIFFADKRNPYDGKRRFLTLFSMTNLSFFLSVMFLLGKVRNSGELFNVDVYISLISAPCAIILDEVAQCKKCTRANKCTTISSWAGLFFLCFSYFLSLGFLITGICVCVSVIKNYDEKIQLVQSFFVSLALGFVIPYIIQLLNWVLPSWDGFLFFPTFYIPFCGRFPKEPICPLLNKFPLNLILGIYGLGGTTYDEDKVEFQKKFPGRIAVDCRSEDEIKLTKNGGDVEKGSDSLSSNHEHNPKPSI